MHTEVLNKAQKELLPLVKKFRQDFYLAGGTAIALHLGHRRSIDFDLFAGRAFENLKIRREIKPPFYISQVIQDETDQFTLAINSVRFTFFHYPFEIKAQIDFDKIIRLPDLLTLGTMKAYALGRRPKWKDYVDLYFIFKHHSLAEIVQKAHQIFKSEFNEKLFRGQLAYFADVDYSEKIDYLSGLKTDGAMKRKLREISLEE